MNYALKFAALIFVLAIAVYAKADPGATSTVRVPVAIVVNTTDIAQVQPALEAKCAASVNDVALSESAISPAKTSLATLALRGANSSTKVSCEAVGRALTAVCSAICVVSAEID